MKYWLSFFVFFLNFLQQKAKETPKTTKQSPQTFNLSLWWRCWYVTLSIPGNNQTWPFAFVVAIQGPQYQYWNVLIKLTLPVINTIIKGGKKEKTLLPLAIFKTKPLTYRESTLRILRDAVECMLCLESFVSSFLKSTDWRRRHFNLWKSVRKLAKWEATCKTACNTNPQNFLAWTVHNEGFTILHLSITIHIFDQMSYIMMSSYILVNNQPLTVKMT